MHKVLIALAVLLSTTAALAAEGRADDIERLQNGATVIKEIMQAPDNGVPLDVISRAKCIAVMPGMLKAAFVVGGAYGKGVASCRTLNGWSAPAFFTLKGGSFGFQIGGESADIVMLIMNDHGMNNLLQSKVQAGRRRQCRRRSRGPPRRRLHRLEDARRGTYLLTRPRRLRRNLAQRRRRRPAQGRYPRLLRPHGALQDHPSRQHRRAQGGRNLGRSPGQVRR